MSEPTDCSTETPENGEEQLASPTSSLLNRKGLFGKSAGGLSKEASTNESANDLIAQDANGNAKSADEVLPETILEDMDSGDVDVPNDDSEQNDVTDEVEKSGDSVEDVEMENDSDEQEIRKDDKEDSEQKDEGDNVDDAPTEKDEVDDTPTEKDEVDDVPTEENEEDETPTEENEEDEVDETPTEENEEDEVDETPKVEDEEEVFVKKVVSMDTSDVQDIPNEDEEVANGGEEEEVTNGDNSEAVEDKEESDVPTTSTDAIEANEEKEPVEEAVEEDIVPTPKRGRGKGRKSAPVVEKDNEEKDEEAETPENKDEVEEEVPSKRERRSTATKQTPKAAPTPKAAATPKAAPTPRSSRRSTAVKAEEKEETNEDEKHEEEPVSERRSLRTRAPPAVTPQTSNKAPTKATPKVDSQVKTPSTGGRGRGRKTKEPEPEPEEENIDEQADNKNEDEDVEEIEETKTPKGRRSSARSAKSTPAEKVKQVVKEEKTPATTPKPAKATPSKKKVDSDEFDPYDMETEMEKHPEPLKNIHMEVQSFGSVKYAKVGSGKYEKTEKAAEARIGNLVDMVPKQKERKSLAEMTPGRKVVANTPRSVLSSKSRSKKIEADDEEEPMEVDETETPKRAQPKKRKSEAQEQSSSAKKSRVQVQLPELDNEEQWARDHPQDEHAPYKPGARVFAVFNKVYYPAIIADERDALARFKVYFAADGIVKDVPSAGIIPLRAVVCDKTCFVDEKVANVLACPNAASADHWVEGQFELEILDDDGEPTGTTEVAHWTKLSLDMSDWRDYISNKSKEATQIVTENISSIDNRHRRSAAATSTPVVSREPKSAARSTAKKESVKTPKSSQVEKEKGSAEKEEVVKKQESQSTPSRGRGRPNKSQAKVEKKSPKKDVEKDDEVNEETDDDEVQEDTGLFDGKVFILTSANRQSDANDDNQFKKKEMQVFIEQHKGVVVDDLKGIDDRSDLQPFLISDTHYRTHKYLAAMARAMPCVSFTWIKECADAGTLTDYKDHLLPAGVALLDDTTYPLPTERGFLLKGKKLHVHSTHYPPQDKRTVSFIDIWKPIVKLLGGTIIDEIPDESFDLLLTDTSAKPEVLEAAAKHGASTVSSEWVIQAIIMSKLPPIDAHYRFRPDGRPPK